MLGCILKLFLFDTAIDHTIQRHQESFIVLCGALIGLVCRLIFTFETALVANLSLIHGVLGLEYDGHIQQL